MALPKNPRKIYFQQPLNQSADYFKA
uniref:Uncharacterized protein n=1 Tax=Rhizophora mucronata TaxID=61149 RepID=A0A2P2PCE1_RHIMU